MPETYGEIFSDMIDRRAEYEDRADIFRKLEIARNHFYNVTNPDRLSSSGKPYYTPTEWGVRMTKEFHDYQWIKTVAKDCNCICITPKELKQLQSGNHEDTLVLIQKIIGLTRGKDLKS